MTKAIRPYWQDHYLIETASSEVEEVLRPLGLTAGDEHLTLVSFQHASDRPNILMSQGSGGNPHIFAELGYRLFREGYNVFIMPRHGGRTITELVERHRRVLAVLIERFGERVCIFAEGLGGYAAFYLALTEARLRGLALMNGPAVLDEERWQVAILGGEGAARRRARLLPVLRLAGRALGMLPVPISLYLDFAELIDPHEPARAVERRLVNDGYRHDPDFDRWYPLSAILSLVTTPPPRPLSALRTPTLLIVSKRGFIAPDYFIDLYERLPQREKELTVVDGSAFWMLSHPSEAAALIARWFDRALGTGAPALATQALAEVRP